MKFRDFLGEAVDIVDTGKKGKEFENTFVEALKMVGLKFEVNRYAGRMWDIKPIGDGWLRLVSDKEVNIKVSGTKWMFGTSELYKMLPWEKLPDDFNKEKAEAKVKRFLNKKGLAQIVYLKPKDKIIQQKIMDAVKSARDDDRFIGDIKNLLVKKNFYIEKLGKSYKVRVLANKERVTSVAIDKGGKVFMRSEKPRSMQGTMMVTFRTPTTKLGKAVQKQVKIKEGVKMNYKKYLSEGLGSAWGDNPAPKQQPTMGAKAKTDPNDHENLIGNINGAIGWLEDIKKTAGYGNMKTAMQIYKQLMKNLKSMEKFLK